MGRPESALCSGEGCACRSKPVTCGLSSGEASFIGARQRNVG